MSPSDRDRRDLEDLAGALFSSHHGEHVPARVVEVVAAFDSGFDEPPRTDEPERPVVAAVDVTLAVGCGEPAGSFALALASLPTAHPRTLLLDPAAIAQGAAGVDAIEREGGRVIVHARPEDGPLLRAFALAATRHIVFVAAGRAGRAEAGRYFEALDYACDGAEVGFVCAGDLGEDGHAVHALAARFVTARPSRVVTALGTWGPGRALPAAVAGFLARPGRTTAPWTWALRAARGN